MIGSGPAPASMSDFIPTHVVENEQTAGPPLSVLVSDSHEYGQECDL